MTGDRVFDLDFTKESQYLFSGHGSGIVRQWDLQNPSNIPKRPIHQLQLSGIQPAGVASALAVIDPSDESELSLVAIAGQYNRLFLWDWRSKKVYKVNYQWEQFSNQRYEPTGQAPVGVSPRGAGNEPKEIQPIIGQYNYINSLTVNENNSLMVTADNRGFITTWNLDKLRQCVQRQQNSTTKLNREQQIQHHSEISDRKPERDSFGNKFEDLECGGDVRIQQWQTGQDGQSVRSVALSADGCYLATAGDDGRVALWLMTTNGQLVNEFPHGVTLNSPSGSPLKTVDIKQPTTDYILVVSDAPGYRVATYRHKVSSYHYCSSPSKLGQVPSPKG
jgi:WD40 repeat protein